MTVDIKEKEQETKQTKKTRKSYVVNNNSIEEKKLVPTTITFKNPNHRLQVTEFYTKLGFTTLNDYIMATIKLSMNDDYIISKLKDTINDY